MFETGFLVALPDTTAAAPVADRLRDAADVVVPHASGRPWLMVRQGVDPVLTAAAGSTRTALVGPTSATATDLERVAAGIGRAVEATTLADRFAGSYLALASVDGELYANGPAMETRRLHRTRVSGVEVLADRADVLAVLGGFEVAPELLALRLVGALPHPLNGTTLWHEVEELRGECYLVVDAAGTGVRQGRWWSVPEPVLGRAEGAELLRDAVREAVASRGRPGEQLACDLSGGLDSTPLCYYAAQGPTGVLARTLFNTDPGGREDLHWAQLALRFMPGVHTHLVGATEELQDFYEGVDELAVPFDEPTQAATAGPRIHAMLLDDRERGIGTHLNGLGGDHVFRGIGAWEHTLARTNPLRAWQRARSEHVPQRIGRLQTLRQLADRRSYRRWYADTVQAALDGAATSGAPQLNDWSAPVTLPPWLTPAARELVRRRALDALDQVEPLDPTTAGHSDLFFIRDAARLVRGTGQIGQAVGVAYEAPLLDDRVVTPVLSVRRVERDTPLEWKPLIKQAMRGVLPDDYLDRTTKVGGGPQSVRGYQRHHAALMALVEDAGLLDSELVDRDLLLGTTAPQARETPPGHVHQAVNAALFLRNLSTRRALAA
ncbi:asparagine synthase-related protein [Desertihabitans aurantiacus]|uniref:asparagine synthase-related protein n=1 Tax=Desertihabitans aurantiacus TaxID=2282477 RepID=UPI000DF7F4F1|nr:asparagine synthase-related protein [Desertihabitans aurantiacus]